MVKIYSEVTVDDIIDAVDDLSDLDIMSLVDVLREEGHLDDLIDDGTTKKAGDAIATLRHKLTTLALYPDMTALDVLDYIEEAIK